jgi:transcriptional regulator with XRE-family HTH domain
VTSGGTTEAAEIGRVLRQVRRSRGLTLKQASVLTGGALRPTSIAGYERGERSISLERLLRLARAYDVRPARLVGEITRRIDGAPPHRIDLTAAEGLGNTEGMLVVDFAHEVSGLRGEPSAPTIVLRAGDLEVPAAASGRRPQEFLERIAPALERGASV